MITLKFYGKLGRKFPGNVKVPKLGRVWRLEAKSIGEAMHAIDVQLGGLFEFMIDMEKDVQGYHVQVSGKDIGEELLGLSFQGEMVKITPLLQGADTKGVIQIVAGVALIAVGVALAYPTLGGSLGLTGMIGLQMVGLGLAVSLGGVARLLMNSPSASSDLATQDPHLASYIFTNPVNTIRQGECVPVAYGRPFIGSAVVSAGVESVDIEA